MLQDSDIVLFCERNDYDLRKTHNGRWIDQKCTPDVVWSISDFVLDYVDTVRPQFTVKDIWQSDYARATIAETFSKPGTDEEKARNEYDKVFSQPLCMLCYAGVLRDISTTSRHLYEIANRDVLEYIAKNDTYSLRFLYIYIEKVLKDSGLYPVFEAFFDAQDNAHFNAMKQAFIEFYHEHTAIQKAFEPKRIFTKVLNPLAFRLKKKGTEGGHISSTPITKADMMYNQDNFRDVYKDKPKDMTRKEWLALHPDIDRRDGYFEQQMSHSKKQLRKFIFAYRGNLSELTMFVDTQNDRAAPTQMHHIFPRNEFPAIMHYIENLIALTPNQHYGFAHPGNNTQRVDPAAQKELLIAKTYSIKQNLESETEERIYEFGNLLAVLATGWEDESVLGIAENDYTDVLHAINYHYQTA
jgi:hypothetical protein